MCCRGRSYYSWTARDIKPPNPPQMYVSVSKNGDGGKKPCCFLGCLSCCRQDTSGACDTRIEKVVPPKPPNTFDFKKPANWMELFSLTLEFVQMASFALQRNPYTPGEDDDSSLTVPPTASPSVGVNAVADDDDISFWGTDLFQVSIFLFEPTP